MRSKPGCCSVRRWPPGSTVAGSPDCSKRTITCRPAQKLDDALEHLARHDDPLDLVGALVDLGDLRVAHHALDREVLGVAVTAEQLHRVSGDFHGGVGGETLR